MGELTAGAPAAIVFHLLLAGRCIVENQSLVKTCARCAIPGFQVQVVVDDVVAGCTHRTQELSTGHLLADGLLRGCLEVSIKQV